VNNKENVQKEYSPKGTRTKLRQAKGKRYKKDKTIEPEICRGINRQKGNKSA